MFSMDLLLGAVVFGVLLGCFYAAVSLGLSVSFGLLDVPHVAHPAFLVLASYGVFLLNDRFDIDPLLAGLLITPLLFVFGLVGLVFVIAVLAHDRFLQGEMRGNPGEDFAQEIADAVAAGACRTRRSRSRAARPATAEQPASGPSPAASGR